MRAREREGGSKKEKEVFFFLYLVCCCITDVPRSCGLHFLSHVVTGDSSPSLSALLPCHICLHFKYEPRYDAKIKNETGKKCNYDDVRRLNATNCWCLFLDLSN